MIECAGLHYSYDGTHDALDGVSLTIADGEFVSVLGATARASPRWRATSTPCSSPTPAT